MTTQQPPDRVTSASRAIPVVLQGAGVLGFVASVAMAIVSVRPDLLAVGGLCALVAGGSYLSEAIKQARQMPPPPAPPAAPVAPAAPERPTLPGAPEA